MLDLVGKPEDRFSHNEAHMSVHILMQPKDVEGIVNHEDSDEVRSTDCSMTYQIWVFTVAQTYKA